VGKCPVRSRIVGFDSRVAVFLVMYSCMKLDPWQVLLILRKLHGLSAWSSPNPAQWALHVWVKGMSPSV
jgi:hypothetical protein